MCGKEFRKQFSLIHVRLLFPSSADFAESPWFGVLVVLLYRFAVAVFCTGWTIRSGFYSPSDRVKWFIYLSNWSFLSVNIYFVCATIVTALHYKKVREHAACQKENRVRKVTSDETRQYVELDVSQGSSSRIDLHNGNEGAARAFPMCWYHEAMWVVYNIAAVAAVLVTVTFWSMIYSSSSRNSRGVSALSIVVHGINSVLIIAETLLSSMPVRLFHVIYPMLYSIVYVVFTVIYWACGGTGHNQQPYIYSQTDYSGQPVLATVSLLSLFFIGLPLCQVFLFGLYVLRSLIMKKWVK